MLFPIWWQLSASLKSDLEIYRWPVRLIPDPIRWSNYVDLFTVLPYGLWFKNSALTALLATFGTCLSSSFVAFALAKLRCPGKAFIFSTVLGSMMLPQQVTMIPLFILFARLKWVNTLYPLIVPYYLGVPFFIFMLRQFFLTLPPELSDAVRMDGGGYWIEYWRIVLPLSKPAMATVAMMAFIWRWNDFFTGYIYISDKTKYTLAVGLAASIFQGYDGKESLGFVMAGCVLMLLPVTVLFLMGQRTLVKGVAMTGITGR
jgi:ABC-type glycerol-3-phosphate transport system permease component